jgi:uncharacterized membrane protein YgdD (TMEM256/DUF423 family)
MNQRTILLTAAILGATAVGLGAFGAHALKTMLTASGRLDTYELAVRYQFYHTLAILATGVLVERFQRLKIAALLLVLGTIVFCGSLYTLALADEPLWGAVTPFGGILLIAGWLLAAWSFYKE